ncbi:dockerin type I domain-containing protein [Anatilimnocola sp. NA78]|uniref:dockerin type I domain-containing protein n=1 Tax=Anatilimnocola sp. NA78 TaxID=3415683 RepID=UPI003CE557DF
MKRHNGARACRLEQLEPRLAMAAAWQNPGQPLDANNDLLVNQADYQLLFNAYLAGKATKPLGTRAAGSTEPYFDVNGNGKFDFADYNDTYSVVVLKKPLVTAKLMTDAIIGGRVISAAATDKLQGRLNQGSWADLSARVSASQFQLTTADYLTMSGASLAAGTHNLELRLLRGTKVISTVMDLAFIYEGPIVSSVPPVDSPPEVDPPPTDPPPTDPPPTDPPPTDPPPTDPPPADPPPVDPPPPVTLTLPTLPAWQNPGQSLDVNNDSLVNQADVTLLMNAGLAGKISKPLGARVAGSAEPFHDVNGDGKFEWSDYNLVSNAVLLKTPTVTAGLKQDTDIVGDRLTTNATLVGRVFNAAATDKLQGRLNQGAWSDLSSYVAGAQFELGSVALAAMRGPALTTGVYTVELRLLRGTKVIGNGMDLQFGYTSLEAPPSVVPPETQPVGDPTVVTQVPWTGSQVPGVVVDFQATSSGQYIGSPSIVILPNGDYVATHDLFGPSSAEDTVKVFVSSDQGATWQLRSTIVGQFFSNLFLVDDSLYLMGTKSEIGSVLIRRSTDGGVTWTSPTESTTGLLLNGSYSTAPTPTVTHNGRVWRAMEFVAAGIWGLNYQPFVMSASVGADLLLASSWTSSNKIVPQGTWLNRDFGGFLEGNIVIAPDGSVVNILRVHQPSFSEKAALVRISADGTTATFNPTQDFIDFPGGSKKFTIRYDQVSGKYWTLANMVPPAYAGLEPVQRTRNTLALVSSTNLRDWQVNRIVLQHADVETTGFQYADWQIAGDDLAVVIRTAFRDTQGNLPPSAHDSNYLTFLRIKNFRLSN